MEIDNIDFDDTSLGEMTSIDDVVDTTPKSDAVTPPADPATPPVDEAKSKKGEIAGFPAKACNSDATGIPTCENALRSALAVTPGVRRMTAILLYSIPSRRWALRN